MQGADPYPGSGVVLQPVTNRKDVMVEHHDEAFGVEPENVDASPVIMAAIIGTLVVITIVIMIFQWSKQEFAYARAEATEMTGYPELRENRLNAERQLSQYDVLDAEQGVYRIPIDRAIDLMAQQAYQQSGGQASGEVVLSTGQ